jgi:hypothetical protein
LPIEFAAAPEPSAPLREEHALRGVFGEAKRPFEVGRGRGEVARELGVPRAGDPVGLVRGDVVRTERRKGRPRGLQVAGFQ